MGVTKVPPELGDTGQADTRDCGSLSTQASGGHLSVRSHRTLVHRGGREQSRIPRPHRGQG